MSSWINYFLRACQLMMERLTTMVMQALLKNVVLMTNHTVMEIECKHESSRDSDEQTRLIKLQN